MLTTGETSCSAQWVCDDGTVLVGTYVHEPLVDEDAAGLNTTSCGRRGGAETSWGGVGEAECPFDDPEEGAVACADFAPGALEVLRNAAVVPLEDSSRAGD